MTQNERPIRQRMAVAAAAVARRKAPCKTMVLAADAEYHDCYRPTVVHRNQSRRPQNLKLSETARCGLTPRSTPDSLRQAL